MVEAKVKMKSRTMSSKVNLRNGTRLVILSAYLQQNINLQGIPKLQVVK